ncbi:MAG: ribonuclease HII [Clostridiales bacterium]|jgi:ribonuclease HII|nr:ribonuclease HII [Clostridiales bacterium]
MLNYEKNYIGYCRIAGVDEAGRGPLAGPLCVAAAIMPLESRIDGVDDSKKLSEKQRERLYPLIVAQAVAYAVVLTDAATIDRVNILRATEAAMSEAVRGLSVQPDLVLIDAVKHVDTGTIPNVPIIKGDTLSYNVAAASILAKVTRDRLMRRLHALYPQYGFDRHKGYGTAAHIAALKRYGPCPLHRTTFIKHFTRTSGEGQ